MSEIRYKVYLIVCEAINMHDLDCHCYICKSFTDAENGSKGHAAACNAVIDEMMKESR